MPNGCSIPNLSESVNVVTRALSKLEKKIKPLYLPEVESLKITPEQFKEVQLSCQSLKEAWSKNASNIVSKSRSGYHSKFIVNNGLLFRECVAGRSERDVGHHQLVVPKSCRTLVLKLAHDAPVAGHFSHRKTEIKVAEQFYWPGMSADIKRYCRSCPSCQKSSIKGRTKPVPMHKMPIIDTPFERVAIDLVGPLSPTSSGGHKYILTLVDYSTSFPEAIPLKSITSIDVAEALMSIFSRVGIPKEILSDRGTQFTSELMYQVHSLIGVKPLFTTPWHPCCNGRIERQHAILKSILKKLCQIKPTEWHRYLPCALFAMREMPSDSLGFSPFELLYGRRVRGPLTILHDLWSNRKVDVETRTTYEFIFELRNRLEETAEIVASNANISANRYKKYFDRKSTQRSFKPNDEVLVLLPESSNKLLMTWKGPFRVLKCKNVDYLIDMNGKHKLFHANMLKKYFRRVAIGQFSLRNKDVLQWPTDNVLVQSCIIGPPDCPSEPEIMTVDSPVPNESINISPELSPWERDDINSLAAAYSDVFSDKPGFTNSVVHKICLTTTKPIKKRVYPIPVHLVKFFDEEVDRMLELGIISPSNSPYCSPVVLVRKGDSSYRITQDFRALNSVTIFDAEPMPCIDHDLHKFTNAKFLSELDICKAYYQIGLDSSSRKYTAFATNRGLMEYNRMPFGLVTACSSYIRLMRKVLSNIDGVSVYFDNIFLISEDWNSHLQLLRTVLGRLLEHGLTARPSKCNFGFSEVNYLGFRVGKNKISPLPSKVDSIANVSLPITKKTLRSFLGMISFYRKFIPGLADLTSPLSDLLKKGIREPLSYTESQKAGFFSLRLALSSPPILTLPDLSRQFCLRTDASNVGLGAVLFQYWDSTPMPVCYASRKLLPRETNYSTIERECLAIIWAVVKLKYYLYGREFILETDHLPLQYLKTFKGENDRLMRWALSLQPYSFHVVYIPGRENHGADFMSRMIPN